MEEEDDDFYAPTDTAPPSHAPNGHQNPPHSAQNGDDAEEEVEVEDDEDEFNIITEAPPDAPPPEIPHPRHASLRSDPQRIPSTESFSAVPKSVTPTPKAESATPVPMTTARPAVPQKPGSAYPPVHASNIDVNSNPIHPATGKPIMLTDMDQDFPADDKPWRRPGSDISDYFNYGFDEFTWASYVLKQQELRREVGDQKKQLDDMQTFMTMGMPPMPGGPPPPAPGPAGAPPGMPGMAAGGMPDMSPDIMQGMLGSMMAQGLDPSSMDPMAFMQHAQAMMGGQAGPGGQPQPQAFGGQGSHQMGFGGYDQRGGFGGRGRGRRW